MRRIGIIMVATGVALGGVISAWRVSDAQRAPRPGVVATVGTLEVLRQDLDRRTQAALEEFERRSGSPVPEQLAPVVRRQALESLIRANLLALEAQRRGVAVSDADAEHGVRRDPVFHPNGQFSARAFENARQNDPAKFQAAIRRAKMEIAARRLQEQLQKQAVADYAALRAAA